MKNLVIVESPSKSKTIEKYLGDNYKVVASMGHIRDLATTGKFGLGVDVENNFEPSYTTMKGKNKVVSELKKLSKDSDMVYLATDPDREGEAISWHVKEALGLKKDYQRVTFNEITKDNKTLLICYKNSYPCGQILYNGSKWIYITSVDVNKINYAEDTPHNLVQKLLDKEIIDNIMFFTYNGENAN